MTTHPNVLVKQIITPELVEVERHIKDLAKEKGIKGWPLFHTKVATFINTKWLESGNYKIERLLDSDIAISMMRGNRNDGSYLQAAVIDISDPSAKGTQKMLSDLCGVPVLLCDIAHSKEEITRFFADNIKKDDFKKNSVRAVNKYEYWMLKVARDALGVTIPEKDKKFLKETGRFKNSEERAKDLKSQYDFFNEIALDKVLDLDWILEAFQTDVYLHDLFMVGRGFTMQELRIFLSRSRLDLLITTKSPFYYPIVALEFNGPKHETSSGKARDAKKKALCDIAGLPLVSVSYRNVDLNDNTKVVDIETKRRHRVFEAVLSNVIGSLVLQVEKEKVVVAIHDQYKRLGQDFFGPESELAFDKFVDRQHGQDYDKYLLSLGRVQLETVKTIDEGKGHFHAEAHYELGGRKFRFLTPSISFKGSGTRFTGLRELFEDALHEFVILYLLEYKTQEQH